MLKSTNPLNQDLDQLNRHDLLQIATVSEDLLKKYGGAPFTSSQVVAIKKDSSGCRASTLVFTYNWAKIRPSVIDGIYNILDEQSRGDSFTSHKKFDGSLKPAIKYKTFNGGVNLATRGYAFSKLSENSGIYAYRDFGSSIFAKRAVRQPDWLYGDGTIEARFVLSMNRELEAIEQVVRIGCLLNNVKVEPKQIILDGYRALAYARVREKNPALFGLEKLIDDLKWACFGSSMNAPEAEKKLVDSNFLLVGVPGLGKTNLATALTLTPTDFLFIPISVNTLMDGMADKNGDGTAVAQISAFRERFDLQAIIYADDLEAAFSDGDDAGVGSNKSGISGFLNLLQGVYDNGVRICGSTNNPEFIDKRLLRNGRLGELIYMPLPDQSVREKILTHYSSGRQLSKEIQISQLAKKTEGFTPDALRVLMESAHRSAAKDFAVRNAKHLSSFEYAQGNGGLSGVQVTADHLYDALGQVELRLKQLDIAAWDKRLQKFCDQARGTMGFGGV